MKRTRPVTLEDPLPTPPVVVGPVASERLLRSLEETLGGRDMLVEVLMAGANSDPNLDYVIGLIADPGAASRNLGKLCRENNVTVGEVLDAIKRGLLAPALVKAVRSVAEKLPQIVDDVVMRSTIHEVPCANCKGLTTVSGATLDSKPEMCPICKGTGTERREPDFDRQKYVMGDLAGFSKKGPLIQQTTIDQSNHLSMDVSAQAHAKLLSGVDKFLYGRRDDPRIRERTEDNPVDARALPE